VSYVFGFTGEQVDSETGFIYLRARYMDPSTGRFISQDPIGLAGGDVNLYGYVGNHPTNSVDPTGLLEYVQEFDLSWLLGTTLPVSAAAALMSAIVDDFSLWPFGVKSNQGKAGWEVGHIFWVQPSILGLFTWDSPVLVHCITDTSLTFESLPGHIDGAGSFLTISTHIDESGSLILRFSGDGPPNLFDLPVLGGIATGMREETWEQFALNAVNWLIAEYNLFPPSGGGGSNPSY
jgi:RHS repeat-associated protein